MILDSSGIIAIRGAWLVVRAPAGNSCMGRKKRRADGALPAPEYKKQKLYRDDGAISAAGALYEYAQRMRLGRVGYRLISQEASAWVVSCVVNDSDMCTTKAGTKASAARRRARGTSSRAACQ